MIALRKFDLLEAAASLLYPPSCTIGCGKTRAGPQAHCKHEKYNGRGCQPFFEQVVFA
jgi:hypothetical protein